MTANRDLKRRVRERQARTGEPYMTALHHVRAHRPMGIPTVELIDVTELATAVGLRCRVSIGPRLLHRADIRATLQAFHDLVAASTRDPALFLMRTVALFGVNVAVPSADDHIGVPATLDVLVSEGLRFARRLRAGFGGVSEHGRLLAMPWIAPAPSATADRHLAPTIAPSPAPASNAHLALYSLWLSPAFASSTQPPLMIVTAHDDFTAGDPTLDFAMHVLHDGEAP